MGLNFQYLKDAPIIELDSIDSTNNYAMRLIDADKAENGTIIIAKEQLQGRGQRGRAWMHERNNSLLMSIIIKPDLKIEDQFLFSASFTLSVAEAIDDLYERWQVKIKWPNDIIINDKKAGGILIENVLRGNTWMYSIVGLGINVLQTEFSDELPNATSLKIVSGKDFNIQSLIDKIRHRFFEK